MLEPVVAQDDVALGAPDQDARRGDAVRTGGDRDAGPAREQDRFIADPLRVAVGTHLPRPSVRTAPVPAADDPDPQPVPGEELRDRDDQRGLAGAADGEVADHDDRASHLPGAAHTGSIGGAAQHREQGHHPSQRRQQDAGQVRRIPETGRLTHGTGELDGFRPRTAAGDGMIPAPALPQHSHPATHPARLRTRSAGPMPRPGSVQRPDGASGRHDPTRACQYRRSCSRSSRTRRGSPPAANSSVTAPQREVE